MVVQRVVRKAFRMLAGGLETCAIITKRKIGRAISMAASPIRTGVAVATYSRKQIFSCVFLLSVVGVMVLFASTSTVVHQYTNQFRNSLGNLSSAAHRLTVQQVHPSGDINANQIHNKGSARESSQEHANIVNQLFKESVDDLDEPEEDVDDGDMDGEVEKKDSEEHSAGTKVTEEKAKEKNNGGVEREEANESVTESQITATKAVQQDQNDSGGEQKSAENIIDDLLQNEQTEKEERKSETTATKEQADKERHQEVDKKGDEKAGMEEKQPQEGKDDGEAKTPQTEGSCQHRDNIALLKMHKCSSSTLQNILFRFGEKHDLTFIMPPRGNYLGYPAPFEKRFAIQVPWNEYNIYTFHSRFSYRGISNMMPSDTIFITVIRDPVKMYESTFTYFRLGARYGLKGGTALRDFLQDAEGYFRSSANKQRIKNPMLYDLGLEANKMHDMSHIEKKIATLGDIFDLVLISEYFDESLILLKELMCWDLDDIVYFKLNARSSSSVRNVTPDMAKKIKAFNAGDVKFYNYFLDSFKVKLKKFGEQRMQEEVAKLRQRKKELENKCILSMTETSNRVYRPPGLNVEDFRLKPGMEKDPMCKYMTLPELPFTSKIREHLYKKIRDYTAKHARLL